VSNLVAQLQKESAKKEKTINKMKTKKEDLEESVLVRKNQNSELLTKLKSCESKLSKLETTIAEQSKPIILSTNSSEPTETEETGCPHLACFVRQPSSPLPSPGRNIFHIPPPSNILILPRSVESYQVFRSLQRIHECEECEKGSLFNNYYEIVHYPDPGPCGGTSGSPVVTCPINPNSVIFVDTREDRKKLLRRNIGCKLCEKKFVKKENLTFHMNRMHIKRT
jgi:hypothetical protein